MRGNCLVLADGLLGCKAFDIQACLFHACMCVGLYHSLPMMSGSYYQYIQVRYHVQ